MIMILTLLVVAVFLLTISSMYIQVYNQCKQKSDSVSFNTGSYKFGVALVIVSILVIVGCIGIFAFGFTPTGKLAGRIGYFI